MSVESFLAVETLHTRIKDIEFDKNPAIIYIKSEITKTKADIMVFLTEEVTNQLQHLVKIQTQNKKNLLSN